MNKSKDIDNVNQYNLSDNNKSIDSFDRNHHSHKSFLWKKSIDERKQKGSLGDTWWEAHRRSIDFRTIISRPTRWTDFFTCNRIARVWTGAIIIGNALNGTLFAVECRPTVRFQGDNDPTNEISPCEDQLKRNPTDWYSIIFSLDQSTSTVEIRHSLLMNRTYPNEMWCKIDWVTSVYSHRKQRFWFRSNSKTQTIHMNRSEMIV